MPDNYRATEEQQLQQVSIRMVQQPPLMANEPLNSPEAVIRVMNDFLSQMDRELFCVVNLQSDLKPINMNIVSVGALNEALVHPREILKSAILSNASSMMLIHNHPSGSLEPSREDITTTDRMVRIGQMMGIPVLDHIIVGRGQEYYSFHERSTIPVVTQSFAADMAHLQFGSKVAEPIVGMSSTIPLPVEGKDINAVMESLEKGMESFLQGDEARYRQYLQVMTKFHSYSLNNTLLIAMQRPDATLCNSYKRWQGLGRQVRAGEKGIKIIAPAPVKQKRIREKKDQNQNSILGANGKPEMEEVEITIPRYKTATIFAYEQTEGEPLPLLRPKELTADVENFELFMKAIEAVAPVPIHFDNIDGGAKGYYHVIDKEIVIQKGMSEAQTMKTAVHECCHSILHDREFMAAQGIEKDTMTKEVESESVAYAVCQAFGLDTSDYSFPYIAGWSHNHDTKDVKASLDVIRKTAGQIIEDISEQLQLLVQERENSRQDELLEAVSPEINLLQGKKAEFGIYQIADGSNGEQYQFMSSDFAKEQRIPIAGNDYELVYTGSWEQKQTLDQIYERFNMDRPADFTGHSLSVSDVIVINNGEEVQAYYVDSFGFTALPDFVQQRENMTFQVPDIDLKAVEQEQLQNLAVEIDAFVYDYDPYSYNDAIDDRESAVDNIRQDLTSGKVKGLKQWLQDVIDEARTDTPDITDITDHATELMGKLEQIEQFRGREKSKKAEQGTISFYVAECSEFPVMGEYHENLSLEEAFDIYESIPSGRMNGVKGIGFNLRDGSDYAGQFDLMTGDRVLEDDINYISHYKEHPLVQKAISDIKTKLAARNQVKEKNADKKQVISDKSHTKMQKRKEAVSL